jgi:hypothetical protein
MANSIPIPTTFDQLDTASRLPFDQANAIISRASSTLVESWGRRLYGSKFGEGYMHSTDHRAALLIILGREPSYREVYDSYHAGSANIDLARIRSQGDSRPAEWDQWNNEQKMLAVLVSRYGINRGSRISDGRVKDPDSASTQALFTEWNGSVTTEPSKPPVGPEDPPVPPKPLPPSPPSLPSKITGTLTLTVDGVLRTLKVTEI